MLRQMLTGVIVATTLTASGALADPASDIEAVKAADLAFHAALSAMDAKAMAALWANKPYVTVIGPASKSALVGYDEAVIKWIETVVPSRYSELKLEMTSFASVQVNGDVAWIVGAERGTGKSKAGEAIARGFQRAASSPPGASKPSPSPAAPTATPANR